jgi:hypothetical protein
VPIPSAARVHNAFGAAAFVRFYYSQLNRAWALPDPHQLDGLNDAACKTCANYVAAAERFVLDQQRVRGISVRVVSAEAPPEQNGLVAVDVFFDEPARAIVTTDGDLVRRLPASTRLHWTVYVKPTPFGWRLRAALKAS